ncbi:MAG: chromosome segregation protein SMC [Candidatus Woesearchaeota archaeon]
MTKINKLVMHGFKSFAKRTELIFGDDFNCILGPNGSGKCVKGDTLVQLEDGSLVRIDELVDNNLKSNPVRKLDDGLIAYGGSTKVLSLDTGSLKTVPRPVQAFVKRKAPKSLLRIKTRSGREITATEYHPLFILKDGKIESIKAEELKEGTRVAVPRKIMAAAGTKYFIELLDMIKAEDSLYVPFKEEFAVILRSMKTKTWKELSERIGIPLNSVKGLLDRQSVNFAHLVRIMRHAGMDDLEIMRRVREVKLKNSSLTCLIPWENTPEFARLLGYLLAEGKLSASNQIWFTNSRDEIVEDYRNLISRELGVRATTNEYKPGCWDVIAYSSAAMVILGKFGMASGTEYKTITSLFLKHSEEEELSALLDGLYSGDGYVSNNSIELTTKSRKLAAAVESILLRLGINFTARYMVKMAANSGFSGIYKNIVVYGADNFGEFHRHVRLTHSEKQRKVENLLGRKGNPNTDLIEANSLVKETAKELGIKVKPNRKSFPKLDAYCYNQCLPSREGITEIIKGLFTRSAPLQDSPSQESFRGMEPLLKLQLLSESDIFWDEITEIETIESEEEWVYDLCIEKDHNFVANNFFVHNSNVLDALCFVLGKTSAKALRSEKSANLIYNGGKARKPYSAGEVSIYFDNSKGTFPTEEKEVKITRIVKKSGQSVYKINNESRTRQQILELLSLARINPDAYNIIMQGDIVKFVEMPPEERRQLVEEISGISIYEEKKNKAVNELNRVEGRIKEAEIVLNERKTRLNELKKERDQATKYKDMQDKIKINKASLLHKKIERGEKEKKEFDDRIEKQQKQLDEKQKEIDKLKEEIKNHRERIDAINKEIEQKGEKEQVDMNKEIEKLRVDIASSKNRVESVKGEIGKIKERRKQLKQNSDDMRQKLKKLEDEKAETQKKVKSREEEIKNIEKKMEDFRKKNKLDDVEGLEKDIDEIDRKAEEKQKEIQDLRQKQQELLREKDRLEVQIQAIDERISKVLEVEKENKEQIQKLKKMKEDFKKATADLNKKLSDDSGIAAQLGNARNSLLQHKEDFSKLQAKSMSIQEKIGKESAVSKVLQQKNKIKGIHGTVSELGKVSNKYSLALEIAAGPRITSIVVQNDQVASKCIQYLKDNRLGIATFLPLNKIKAPQKREGIDDLKKANGVHGTAIDLINFDPKFRDVFSYVFGNTLVVDSIDVARRIGIGKARMVTLDGDMAEVSGAMQGGFRKKGSTGLGFSEKEVEKDIKECEKKLKDTEDLVSRLEKDKKKNEEEIEKLRHFKANLEGDIIKIEKSLHLDSEDTDASRKEKEKMQKSVEEMDKKIEDINDKITGCNKELAENKSKRQEIRNRINELRNPALLAELNAFEEKRNQLREELVNLNGEIKNLEAQKTNVINPELENLERISRQNEKEEQDFKEELEMLNKEITNMSSDLREKEEKQKRFQSKFKDLFSEKSKLDEKIRKNEEKIDAHSDKVKEIEKKINQINVDAAKVKAELAGHQEEFKEYEGVHIVKNKSEQELKKEIGTYEGILTKLGSVNMRALEVYDQVEKEYNELSEKKEKLVLEKEDVLVMINEIETKKKDLFMKTFDVVNENFQSIFSALTTKGEASLVLENPDSPFDGGLMIKVKLSGSKMMDIRSLSGGEKSLTALAFIFSIQEHEPASFYVLDEVDAALDKKNSEKLSQLVKKYSEKAQYVVISHNDGIITEASILYGVSMDEHGMSNVVSLKV